MTNGALSLTGFGDGAAEGLGVGAPLGLPMKTGALDLPGFSVGLGFRI
jgi:hypothetical protein